MRASAASAASPRPWRVHHMGSPTPLLLFPSTSSIASNAAFLSALLPPLPSPPPSDLILYFQEPEHQEPAAPDLVRKRPAPDVYLLPPPRHVTGDLFVFDVTAPTGGSAAVPPVMLSLPVQGPATQRRRQSYGVMLTLPLQSSEPVSSDDLDEAQRELVTPFCTSTHRVTAYFAEAMLDRLVSSCHDICLYAPLPHASYPEASRLAKSRTTAAFQTFSPFAKFSRFKAKQATQEAFEGQDLGDIHHITIMEGLQCPGLADILASRTRGPPRVRLTVLGASMEALEAMLARLVTSCHDICLYVPLPHASYPAAYRLAKSRTTAAFQTSNAISRFAKFSHFKARQAIKDKEEFQRQDLGHIHRIMIMQGLQWPGLAHILASRTRGQPRVRLTVLGASMEALEATGRQTSDFAKVLFYKFCPVAYTPGNLDSEKLDANDSNTLCLVQSITFIDQSPEKFANLQFNFSFNDQQVTKNEMKWALEKHDDGEELSQTNPGLNTTPLGFVKCSNTHTPGCESHKEKTICDLDEKCEYELPKVCLRVENREKHKKKEKAKSRLFTTLKVTGIRNRTRYLLLLVLFCTFITAVGSSSRAERSRQGFCPKPDVIQLLFPPHQIVCPVVDISSVHWTHSKRSVPHKNQQWEGICELIVLIVSVICSCGPWYSVYTLQPVQGKKYKFLFYFKVEPARMWYFTLAASINYYASMVAYGVMLNSDHKCGTWVPNAIYCSMFLLCVAFLCCREKMIFQVGNLVLLVTCVCCVAGAGLIGLVHWLCIRLHPAEFEKIFYFEKIAFSCLIAMYIFRGFTMEPTPLNFS